MFGAASSPAGQNVSSGFGAPGKDSTYYVDLLEQDDGEIDIGY